MLVFASTVVVKDKATGKKKRKRGALHLSLLLQNLLDHRGISQNAGLLQLPSKCRFETLLCHEYLFHN